MSAAQQPAEEACSDHATGAAVRCASQRFKNCLTIAHDSYPYIEARALTGLAATQLSTDDPTSAHHTAEQAIQIAGTRGYRLLEKQAQATLQATAEKQNRPEKR